MPRPTVFRLACAAFALLIAMPAALAATGDGPSMSALISGTAPRDMSPRDFITSDDLAAPMPNDGPVPRIPSQATGVTTTSTTTTTVTETKTRSANDDKAKREAMDKACAPVVKACVKARFGVGIAGRDLLTDCVNVITDYKTVSGTAPTALSVTNCRLARRHVEDGIPPPQPFVPRSPEAKNPKGGFKQIDMPVNAMVKRQD